MYSLIMNFLHQNSVRCSSKRDHNYTNSFLIYVLSASLFCVMLDDKDFFLPAIKIPKDNSWAFANDSEMGLILILQKSLFLLKGFIYS